MGVLGLPGPGKVAEGQEVVEGGSHHGQSQVRAVGGQGALVRKLDPRWGKATGVQGPEPAGKGQGTKTALSDLPASQGPQLYESEDDN